VTFLATYIMKGRMQAILVASTLAVLSLLLPPISIVSSASVALVTLRRGGNEGLYVLVCACLSSAVLGFFLLGNVQVALLFALILWLPVWVISIVLREGKHLSVAVEMAVLMGILGVLGCYIYFDDPAQLWLSILSQMVQPMIAGGTDVPVEDIKQTVQLFSRFMTGGIAAGTVYGLLFGLFLARWWQSALYNPGGFRSEFLSLRVHPKMAVASIIVVAIAWFMSGIVSEICWNITILFVVLYTFVGTAILHASFSEMKMKRFMVPFLYITLVLVPHMIAIVVMVGVVDVWLDLRSKILEKTDS
jgi:tetrahydromethanopterin S-methyltransferase subunit F